MQFVIPAGGVLSGQTTTADKLSLTINKISPNQTRQVYQGDLPIAEDDLWTNPDSQPVTIEVEAFNKSNSVDQAWFLKVRANADATAKYSLANFTLAALNAFYSTASGVTVLDATGHAVVSAGTFTNGSISGTLSVGGLLTATGGVTTGAEILPTVNDGAALGDATHNFSDLFLATGAVLNYANSNVVVTHSSGILTMGTGELRITTAGTNSASVPTLGSTSTLTNKTLTSPTMTAPVLGVATGTSLAVTGLLKTSSPTAGFGYATGAGGTVTQLSSRTTGVTLDTACGNIVLFSAAGSATPFSFTVTCAAVGIGDVIIISQKSGTDKYTTQVVTAVGAGSFQLTLANASGTTTEQPVFNFAVIKGVAA